MNWFLKKLASGAVALAIISLSACTTTSNLLNPFYEPPSEVALQGAPNDHALNSNAEKESVARVALEQMSTYQRAHAPNPNNPVVQPSVVRLLWIPDHLNSSGDLVPAHYYYLKVKSDQWAAQDAFDLESQLHGPRGALTNTPYIYAADSEKTN